MAEQISIQATPTKTEERLALDVYDEEDAQAARKRFHPDNPKDMTEMMNYCYRSGYVAHASQPVVFTPTLLAEACEKLDKDESNKPPSEVRAWLQTQIKRLRERVKK